MAEGIKGYTSRYKIDDFNKRFLGSWKKLNNLIKSILLEQKKETNLYLKKNSKMFYYLFLYFIFISKNNINTKIERSLSDRVHCMSHTHCNALIYKYEVMKIEVTVWCTLLHVFQWDSYSDHHCMKHLDVLEKEIQYINNLHGQLQGKVVTKKWTSDVFTFLKGVFQGDPYSANIFLVVFQPLLDFLF